MAKSDDILAKQLWALGDLARLKILRHLPHSENCEHGNNVSQLADMLGLAQPTVSHHLRVLRQAGLVSNKKMCRDVFYWVNQAEAEVVIDRLRAAMCAESAATESVPASRPNVH